MDAMLRGAYIRPGTSVRGTDPNEMGRIPYTNPSYPWAANSGTVAKPGGPAIENLLRGENRGIAPNFPASTGVREIAANTYIAAGYLPKPWEDGSHNKLVPGEIFFIQSEQDALVPQMDNLAGFGRLNILLRNMYIDVSRSKNEEHALFFAALKSVPEDELYAAVSMKENYSRAEYDEYMAYKESTTGPYLGYLMKKYLDKNLKNLTMPGIMDTWKLMGIIQSVPDASHAVKDRFFAAGGDRMNVIGAVVQRKHEWATNYFGGSHDKDSQVKVLQHLVLILKRVKHEGKYAEFQFVPYACQHCMATPPEDVLIYEDDTGQKQYGKVFFVGIVTDKIDKHVSPQMRYAAAGIGDFIDIEHVYEAVGSLPNMQLQVGV